MPESPRRFIAGAICPACQKQDKIFSTKTAHAQTITCVQCHFSQTQVLSEKIRAPFFEVHKDEG